MNRADKVLVQVAAWMQDSEVIREALNDAIRESIREGYESHIMIDIASAIEEASREGISQAHWETVGTRLLHRLERYARAALTEKAEDDIAQDDEDNDL